MFEQKNKVYRFQSLSQYHFKNRLLIRIAGWCFYAAINLIGKTLRVEIDGVDYTRDRVEIVPTPILCLWHDRIFTGTYYLRDRGLVVMSSISLDAEYTARCIQRFGFGVIKGSSTRGGARALIEMSRLMKTGVPMAFTIDGPRGPKYEAKPGPALLAKLTGNPMLPFSVEVKRFWTINSWDKLQIPRPFTRAKVFFGGNIFVSPDADGYELEQKRLELQESLNDLVQKGIDWADQN